MLRPRFSCLLHAVFAMGMSSAALAGNWDLSRYQEPGLTDSLLSRHSSPLVIVLDRELVEIKSKGTSAYADVSRDHVVFVREPGAVDLGEMFSYLEYPGREIKKLDAYRVRPDEVEGLDVDGVKVCDCDLYRKHERRLVELDDVGPGDIIAVRSVYRVETQNPVLTHGFHGEYPIVQSDITFDVSNPLLEGKTPGVWAWWAGSFPGHVPQQVWPRPSSHRFRWGAANLPPAPEEARSVLTSWAFDPSKTSLGKLVYSEAGASGGGAIGYRGTQMNARQLTGMDQESRHDGISRGEHLRPTEASFGDLHWEDIAALYCRTQIEERVEERHLPKLVAKIMRGAGKRDVLEHIVATVHGKVKQVDLPLAAAINDIHRPMETYERKCASSMDLAVCIVGMLRVKDIDAYPVLLERERLETNCRSLEVFDEVGVIVRAGDGLRYVDIASGRISGRMPSGFRAALTLPVDGRPKIVLGDDVAALVAR